MAVLFVDSGDGLLHITSSLHNDNNGVFVGVCVCISHKGHFYLLFRNGMIVRVQSSEGEGKIPPNTLTFSQKMLKTIYGCMFDFIYISDCIRNVKCPCIYQYFILFILCVIRTASENSCGGGLGTYSSPNRKCVSETRVRYRVRQRFHFWLIQKQCGGGL